MKQMYALYVSYILLAQCSTLGLYHGLEGLLFQIWRALVNILPENAEHLLGCTADVVPSQVAIDPDPQVITIPPSMKIRWKILCLVALVIEITLHFFRVNQESDMITGSVVRAATGIQTHAAAILWVSHPAGRQKESDPPRTALLPTFYFWVAPIPPWTLPQPTHGYPTHGSPPTADSQPLKADSHSCSPTLTLPWVSIQSEIPGRNSAAQSVRSQCGDFLTPFAVWAATGIRTHLLRSSESAI